MVDGRAVCIRSPPQDCSTEWGGAYIVIFVSCCLWCSITIGFVLTHSKWVSHRRREWGLERIQLFANSTWHLDVWRFIVQRDVRTGACSIARTPPLLVACTHARAPAYRGM